MYFWVITALTIFFLSLGISSFLIPKILRIAFKKKLFDTPDDRKVHKTVIPRLGGIIFTPTILFSIIFVLDLFITIGLKEKFGYADFMPHIVQNYAKELSFSLCCLILLAVVGFADDLIGVSYKKKFLAQLFCSMMLLFGGISVQSLSGILWGGNLSYISNYILTIIVIIFIINAINLIDGINGLASGLCILILSIYSILFFIAHQYLYALIVCATIGVLLPFFYYNVFGKAEQQKKIFMGDTGSLTLGFILSMLSLKLHMCYPIDQINDPMGQIPFIIIFSPLLIPALDTVHLFAYRISKKENPFKPDKNHIHHRFLSLGLNQGQTLTRILILSLAITVFNILLVRYININILLILDIIFWFVLKNRLHKRSLLKNINK